MSKYDYRTDLDEYYEEKEIDKKEMEEEREDQLLYNDYLLFEFQSDEMYQVAQGEYNANCEEERRDDYEFWERDFYS